MGSRTPMEMMRNSGDPLGFTGERINTACHSGLAILSLPGKRTPVYLGVTVVTQLRSSLTEPLLMETQELECVSLQKSDNLS